MKSVQIGHSKDESNGLLNQLLAQNPFSLFNQWLIENTQVKKQVIPGDNERIQARRKNDPLDFDLITPT